MLMICPKCSSVPERRVKDEVGEITIVPAHDIVRQFSGSSDQGILHCGNCGFGVEASSATAVDVKEAVTGTLIEKTK